MTAPVRSRNSWYFLVTELEGEYEFSLGYKYSGGEVTYFSGAGRTDPNKVPWDPPISAEFKMLRKNGVLGQYFRFMSSRGENQNMSIRLLNNLIPGGSDFARRCTGMVIDRRFDSLAQYITLLVHSVRFSHHKDYLHNVDGTRKDGGGIQVKDLDEKGGNIEDFLEFKSYAEKAAFSVSRSRESSRR